MSLPSSSPLACRFQIAVKHFLRIFSIPLWGVFSKNEQLGPTRDDIPLTGVDPRRSMAKTYFLSTKQLRIQVDDWRGFWPKVWFVSKSRKFWFVPETSSIIISRWLLKVAGLSNRAGASNEPSIGVENLLAAKPLHVWHAGSKQETT